MTDAPPPPVSEDVPPHLAGGAAVPRPMAVSPIHVRAQGRCLAAFVVNVDAEDPLGGEFTVDAVVFEPPNKARDKFTRANTRPGVTRWCNNMRHATVAEEKNLTWHYPGEQCLPPVVMELISQQRE